MEFVQLKCRYLFIKLLRIFKSVIWNLIELKKNCAFIKLFYFKTNLVLLRLSKKNIKYSSILTVLPICNTIAFDLFCLLLPTLWAFKCSIEQFCTKCCYSYWRRLPIENWSIECLCSHTEKKTNRTKQKLWSILNKRK